MNIAAAYNMTPAADKPWTREDDIRSSMGLCALLLARGMLYVQSVTASRVWPLAKAQEKLDAARGHYVTAKKRGATDARLAQLAADGLTLAAAIKAAEVIAAPALARNAERAKAKAAAAAERLQTIRLQRQYILNNTTKEAAHHVARELARKGLFVDPPAALAAIVDAVKAAGVSDLKATTPDQILAAWLRLDP